MFCGNCGKEIHSGIKFCGNCGTKVENENFEIKKEEGLDDKQEVIAITDNSDNHVNDSNSDLIVDNSVVEIKDDNNSNDNVVMPSVDSNVNNMIYNTSTNMNVNNMTSDMSNTMSNNNSNNLYNQNSFNNPNPYFNNGYVPAGNNLSNMNGNNNNKGLLIGLVVTVLVLFAVACFLLFTKDDKKDLSGDKTPVKEKVNYDNDNVKDRTILIYLCGSDLESRIGMGTSDLASVDVDKIDLETTNVVVYTGGSKKWHNYVSNSENAIYVLEEEGFVKKEIYDKASMGSANTLSTLLDYGYKNYGADKYDLIMWNHGLGSLGISSDELFGDFLTLDEIKEALEKSYFTDEFKFETVIFRSCLNGTLEMANIFVPYANYFVASEEVTYGIRGVGIFDFLNDLEFDDTGVDVGKSFISSYIESLEYYVDTYYSAYGRSFDEVFPVVTYSILDLSKLEEVSNSLNSFVKDINLDLEYNNIARARSNLYQYATNSNCNDYDTVDLETLIEELKVISSKKADIVLDALDEAVVYNWSNNEHSNGLAVYFPYNSANNVRKMHYSGYKNLSKLSDYYSFIVEFDSIQSLAYDRGFSAISKANVNINVDNKKISLKLNDDDKDNYAKASYIIFEKNSDGTFKPVYTSDSFELGESDYTMDLDNTLVEVVSAGATGKLLSLSYNGISYYTDVILTNAYESVTARIYFDIKDKVNISNVVMTSEGSSTGIILNINDYTKVTFLNNNYNVLKNENVNYDWHSLPIENNIELSNYMFKKVELNNNYYVMFKIYDVDNLFVYSDLVQVK